MVLVDTSVLIGYLKGTVGIPYQKMKHLVDNGLPFGICNHVYQELLQGAYSKKEFETLKNYLGVLPFYDLMFGKRSYENAAQLYFDCRKKGITIRSSIDLIIAEIAIENDLFLLHNDKDYIGIAQVNKMLKFY
jgi:predicted nucleic acid-binding protein